MDREWKAVRFGLLLVLLGYVGLIVAIVVAFVGGFIGAGTQALLVGFGCAMLGVVATSAGKFFCVRNEGEVPGYFPILISHGCDLLILVLIFKSRGVTDAIGPVLFRELIRGIAVVSVLLLLYFLSLVALHYGRGDLDAETISVGRTFGLAMIAMIAKDYVPRPSSFYFVLTLASMILNLKTWFGAIGLLQALRRVIEIRSGPLSGPG